MKSNRRTFITSTAGLTVALGAMPRFALAGDGCSPPYPVGTPIVPWLKPGGQSVSNRMNANALTTAQLALLRRAYFRMQQLPSSDPRSMDAQRNIHAWYCASCPGVPVPDIHGHWTFFPWHRGFLYFHERILGSLVNDMTLRLPYWSWENPATFALPGAYSLGGNPLYDVKRYLKAGQSVERHIGPIAVYDLTLVHALVGGEFSYFAGTETEGGNIEFGSHGFVHNSTGGVAQYDPIPQDGDMADLNTAARDPIFFAHHGNIDRLWYSWSKVSGHANPDGAFRALRFTYYDPEQKWISMSCADMLDTASLGYEYDAVVKPAVQKILANVPLSLMLNNTVGPATALGRKALENASTATLNLSGLAVEGDGVFEVLLRSGGGTHVLGDIFVTPHGGHMHMAKTRRANIHLPISAAAAHLLAEPGSTLLLKRVPPSKAHSNFLLLPLATAEPARINSLSVSIHH